MKIVTVISDEQHFGFATYLKPSCEYHGLELVPLVSSEKLKPKKAFRLRKALGLNAGEALLLKDKLLADYLATIPDNEIIVFTDGYDTMFLAGEDELRAKFDAFQHPLVFSAEINCHPREEDANRFPSSPTPSRYLNSGGLMGTAKAIRDAMKKIQHVNSPRKYAWSNQYRWIQLFLDEPESITLDYANDIFFCGATTKDERGQKTWTADYWRNVLLKGDRVCLPGTDTYPCHLHFNGPLSVVMKDLEDVFSPLMPWKERHQQIIESAKAR